MRRALFVLALAASACLPPRGPLEHPMHENDGRHDFDFYAGTWSVENRRLRQRHVGSQDWETFPGHTEVRPLLGGLGNVDELWFPTQGWSGSTLRLFDLEKKTWSLYWVSSRQGVLQPPVVGRFVNGVGDFFGDDEDQGRPIKVRYRWSDLSANGARWEQAFSLDGGKSWETNWVMTMTRTGR